MADVAESHSTFPTQIAIYTITAGGREVTVHVTALAAALSYRAGSITLQPLDSSIETISPRLAVESIQNVATDLAYLYGNDQSNAALMVGTMTSPFPAAGNPHTGEFTRSIVDRAVWVLVFADISVPTPSGGPPFDRKEGIEAPTAAGDGLIVIDAKSGAFLFSTVADAT